jgi:predicted HicB family RNase H-like nuclease
MNERDKYLKIVEWSEEDQCYVGSVPGWIGPCCHGKDEMRVYRQLCQIVDEWIEIYKKENRTLPPPSNKNYSGKFVLRTGPELHRALALQAMKKGESINTYIVKALKEAVFQ